MTPALRALVEKWRREMDDDRRAIDEQESRELRSYIKGTLDRSLACANELAAILDDSAASPDAPDLLDEMLGAARRNYREADRPAVASLLIARELRELRRALTDGNKR